MTAPKTLFICHYHRKVLCLLNFSHRLIAPIYIEKKTDKSKEPKQVANLNQVSPRNAEKPMSPERSLKAELSKSDQPLNIVTDENEDLNDKFNLSNHQDFSPKDLDDV